MDKTSAEDILERIEGVRMAVYGDFALDAYWMLDPRGSEMSVETGLEGQAVGQQYYTLGGASNVTENVLALEPAEVRAIGAIGRDIFGRELVRQLRERGADCGGLVQGAEDFDTVTFAKRYLDGEEQPRIDFGFYNRRTPETNHELLEELETALENCDALVFNQQVPGTLDYPDFLRRVNELFEAHEDTVVVLDTRHYGDEFTDVIRNINAVEAALLCGDDAGRGETIPLEDSKRHGRELYRSSGRPVFITRGSRGMLAVDENGCHEIPGIELMQRIDPVGAGDAATAALAPALAAGASPADAAELANCAAAVTVTKLFRTGTATPEEILDMAADPDYAYRPELAEDQRRADYLDDTEVELCYPPESLPEPRIRHAVFDSDGTFSALRQGWPAIMEDVMVRCILGGRYDDADPDLLRRVREEVRDYIDRSTGLQTILQMEQLVEMVKRYGFVPEDEVLEAHGYKDIYDEALMKMVDGRIDRLRDGRLEPDDFMIKGAREFARELANRGVTLYLASGTDRDDVRREARVLGYAELFEDRIYGAVGDVSEYSKRMVIRDIMREHDLSGPELAVFGDGPVELRECRKAGGIPVGAATDEVRRFGLNEEKRRRLVRAGAYIVVPDFTWGPELLDVLFD